MKQTIFCTLVFSLFASSCVATAEPSRRVEQVQQGVDSLAHVGEAHATAQNAQTTGDDIAVDPVSQPWHGGDDVAVDPVPQPWHGGDVSVDPVPQPWHEGPGTPTTNPAENESAAATK